MSSPRLFAICCAFSFFTGLAAQSAPSPLPEFLGTLESERSSAEEAAARLRSMLDQQQIRPVDYDRGGKLYSEARAAFDGWIAAVRVEVSQGTLGKKAAQYEQKLQAAVARRKEFDDYVARVAAKGEPTGGGVKEVAAVIAAPLIQAVATYVQRDKEGKRKELLEQLESKRWKAFSDVAVARNAPAKGAGSEAAPPRTTIKPVGPIQNVRKQQRDPQP